MDATLCCAWIVAFCEPCSVGFLYHGEGAAGAWEDVFKILKPFGFFRDDLPNCKVLLAVDAKGRTRWPASWPAGARQAFWFTRSDAGRGFASWALDIDNNLLDMAVELPDCLDGKNRKNSLFVLDAGRDASGRKKILFADMSGLDKRKIQDAMRSGSRTDVRKAVMESLQAAPQVVRDFRDVLLRHESLSPSWQIPQAAAGASGLSTGPCLLSSVADIIRVPSFMKIKDSRKEFEILKCLSPKQYAPYGYTAPSGAEEKAFARGRVKSWHELRPLDIVLVTQGNIGKVCLISPDFQEKGWIPTSFSVIIRPKHPDRLDPHALFLALASQDVQREIAGRIDHGSASALLHTGRLQSLPVPVPEKKAMPGIFEKFARLEAIREQNEALDAEARRLLAEMN